MLLLCCADIHGEGAGMADVVAATPGVSVVIVAGDLTHLGGPDEAAAVVDPVLAAGARLLAVPGNMDRPDVLGWLEARGLSLHGRGVTIDDVGFLGLGGSNPTPFGTPFEVDDREASGLLEAAWPAVARARVRVLVSHAPPRDTTLDLTRMRMHAGSIAVRAFLEEHDVTLCLCGHIHEARGEARVGPARCVNLGALKSGSYALVDIRGGAESGIDISWRSL
jgi:uncharacterized protein